MKHFLYEVAQLLGVDIVNGRVGASQDFNGEAIDGLGVECVAQVAHLIEHAAEGPHIRLVTVGLILKELGRHVVRGPDACVCEVFRAVEDLGYSEIAQTDLAVPEENVLGLQVAMKDLPFMKVEQSKCHLHEPIEDLLLRKVLRL